MRYAPTLVRLNSLLDWVVRWFRFRPCGGRMRYAPTLVRLNSLLDWVVCWFRFRPREGVCDTPLHFAADYVG